MLRKIRERNGRLGTSFSSGAAVVLMAGLGLGCAARIPHPEFLEQNAGVLHVGMPPDSVQSLLGRPDSTWIATFGSGTGRPWRGLVWRYQLDPDPLYVYNERPLTNTLVFWDETTRPALNHWKLEQVRKPGEKPLKRPKETRDSWDYDWNNATPVPKEEQGR
jgi:hypothetical protein